MGKIVIPPEIAGIKTNEELLAYLATLHARAESYEVEAKAQAAMFHDLREGWRSGITGAPGKQKNEAAMALMGNFLKAVASDNRAKIQELGGAGGLPATKDGEPFIEKTLMGTPLVSDSPTGQYLAPTATIAEVARIAQEQSQLMGAVCRIPMSSRTASVPVADDELDFSWITSQGSAGAEVNPTFTSDTLTSKTAILYCPISEELLEDSAILLGEYFTTLVGEAWARAFERGFLTSTTPWTGLLHDADAEHVVAVANVRPPANTSGGAFYGVPPGRVDPLDPSGFLAVSNDPACGSRPPR